MKLEKLVKKEILLTVASVVLIMTIFIGVSYASFRNTSEGETNEITFGNIELSYCADEECDETISNIGQVIGTEKVGDTTYAKSLYPTSDEKALLTTPYIFKVTNNGTLREVITIYLEEDETFIPGGTYEDYQNALTTHGNYINIAFEGTELTRYQKTYAQLANKKLAEKITLEPGETRIYKLWAWISNTGPNTIQGTYFVANIRIEGEYLPERSTIKEIVASSYHSVALKSNGDLLTWGNNDFGQLGNNTTEEVLIPTKIEISQVKKVSSNGGVYNMVLKENGEVWGWGDNRYGQLGTNNNESSLKPIGPILNEVKDIGTGQWFSAVLKENGEVWTWGLNMNGQLGNNSNENSSTPIGPILTDVAKLFVGTLNVFAIKENGEIWTWGDNRYGQLGITTSDNCGVYNCSKTPIKTNLSDIKTINTGNFHTVALKENGEVWTWGRNNYGQLGNNTTENSLAPVGPILSGVKEISAGAFYTIALKENNEVWIWGENETGELGIESFDYCDLKCSKTPIGPVMNNVKYISSIVTYHTYIIKENGEVWTWGHNYSGQLGDGTKENKNIPTKIIIP